MNRKRLLILVPVLRMITLLTAIISSIPAVAANHSSPPIEVVIETELGDIVIEVYKSQAPKTSAYFLGFIERGDYNSGNFYRAGTTFSQPSSETPPHLIQGGILYNSISEVERHGIKDTGVPMLEEIETTNQTGLKHQYGTVSLARDLFDSGFVIPEIFICLEAIPSFDASAGGKPDDRGFPAFAKVIEGMDVVERIARRETAGEVNIEVLKGQILTQPVSILNASHRASQVTRP